MYNYFNSPNEIIFKSTYIYIYIYIYRTKFLNTLVKLFYANAANRIICNGFISSVSDDNLMRMVKHA